VFLLYLALVETTALTIQLDKNAEECFYMDVQEKEVGELIFFRYQVIKGGRIIIAELTAPNGFVMHSSQKLNMEVSLAANWDGEYKLCFKNPTYLAFLPSVQGFQPKLVDFKWTIGDAFHEHHADDVEDALDDLEMEVEDLSDLLDEVEDHVIYINNREKQLRDLAESTHSKVLWFQIFKSVLLLSVSAVQVISLRRFFEVRRSM